VRTGVLAASIVLPVAAFRLRLEDGSTIWEPQIPDA
jgi:hypothetical protein